MPSFKKTTLKTFRTRGFNLTPVELKDVVPFEVKRVYYFDDMQPGQQTGEHCHKIEEEFFIQMKGSSVAIIDQGNGKEEVPLQGPGDAIYCPAYVWHGFKNASADSVILALSSTNYSADRSDYIEDYNAYLGFRDEKLK
jgi:uncharacterized cupin superfamily protein